MGFDTSSILRMIGALGGAVGGIAGSFGGTSSPTSLGPASSPSLDDLTLNPQVMGQNPPRVPYDFGQGQNVVSEPTQPPMAPPGQPAGKSTSEKIKSGANAITDVGKAIMNAGKFKDSMDASPLAQKMFQESQAGQVAANQAHINKIEEFRRRDLSSQILEKYGLL